MISRIQEFQAHLSQLEQFNQVLMTFTQWSENFLRQLRTRSKVTITDLTPTGTQIKVKTNSYLYIYCTHQCLSFKMYYVFVFLFKG